MMEWQIEQVDWQAHREELLRIRYRVFVDEQGVPAELEHDEHDSGAMHLLARTAGKIPVATARMLGDGHIGRMAVLPAWRRHGIGSALLRKLIGIAHHRGMSQVHLHAQCHAESFYRRLGFVAEGEVFPDAGIDHRRMNLRLPASGD